jgi:EAL domain-containing protein (putative c-di-GMP-specific phosphodiesterase class I)
MRGNPTISAGRSEQKALKWKSHTSSMQTGLEQSHLRERIAALLENDVRLVGGGIQFLGLDALKARMGSAWPRHAEHVHDVAERIIRQHLSPHDLLLRVTETHFLILFVETGAEIAKFKCGVIAKMIAERFEGETELSDIHVHTVVKEIDGRLGLKSERLDEILHGMLEDRTAASGSDETSRVEHEAQEDQYQGDRFSTDAVEFVYRDILDARQLAVFTFRIVPVWTSRYGFRHEGYGILDAVDNPDDRVDELDRHCLKHCLSSMNRYFLAGRKAVFALNVHFSTLSHSSKRMALIDDLNRAPKELKSYLILEIAGLPEGVPASRIAEIVAILKPHCRHVTAAVRLDLHHSAAFVGTGLFGVTIDLDAVRAGERSLLPRIDRFVGQATKVKLRTGIAGIQTSSLLLCCVAAGCHWVEGPYIGKSSQEPRAASRFTWLDCYARRKVG